MDQEMEPSSGGSLLPLALAVLAIVLGGAALYFGLTANQRLSPLATSLEAGSSSAARLEEEISGLQTQLAELSAQQSELSRALERSRIYSSQSEQAMKRIASEVKENREQLVKLAEGLNELANSAVTRRPAVAESVESDGGSATANAVASEARAPGTYAIKGGDTFAKIAAREGISLQALLDANPDANPSRLQIGQIIQLPGR